MDLYSRKSKSIPQKVIIILLQLLLLLGAYWILFRTGGSDLLGGIGLDIAPGYYLPRLSVFFFSIIVFVRMTFMICFLLKRAVPWEESISVPLAFALYYVGFALLVYGRREPLDWIDMAAIALFFVGSFLNTVSELQRHYWKQQAANKGKLYTEGLFSLSMHINYFGDFLWVTAYAILTRNPYAAIIPVFLFCFFAFYNIPKLDAYLADRYGEQFVKYRKNTSRFIPFIY